jgi:hypothetical protein
MTAIGAIALQEGNPYKMINGIDDKGRICGVSHGVQSKAQWYVVTVDFVGGWEIFVCLCT